jgi:GH24 family phage-related lysozyme (muramidase)
MEMSESGKKKLKKYEHLRLFPYDDKTGKDLEYWKEGATIGYGHLIAPHEWIYYMIGISKSQAEQLFLIDLCTKGEKPIDEMIDAEINQNQYDALVMLVFNIGDGQKGFKGSTVRKMINNPEYKSSEYPDLKSAWLAWNKQDGKFVRGLLNRRKKEWRLYNA